MKLRQVKEILNADEILINDQKVLERELSQGFSSDLMSDALALVDDGEKTLFLTGLVNNQTLRTAEMLDIDIIVFVRNKVPDVQMIEMAKSLSINILSTSYTMYEACGRLYQGGLHND